MPNHWHLLLWPRSDGELSEVMRWITVPHTQRWHAHRHSSGTGPVYQGRFKSFPVQTDEHFLTVARYVERNALRAKLVERAEEWQWSSVYRRGRHDAELADFLSPWPMERPQNWIEWINEPDKASELDDLRSCAQRGRPFGSESTSPSNLGSKRQCIYAVVQGEIKKAPAPFLHPHELIDLGKSDTKSRGHQESRDTKSRAIVKSKRPHTAR